MNKCVNCGFEWTEGKGSHDCWAVKDARVAELEAEVKELRKFRNACVSLTGTLWPHNETTEYLNVLLEKADD